MYPELFSIGSWTIHTYGILIATGALLGFWYMAREAKGLGVEMETIQSMAILIILASIIGGKFFFYLEKPSKYFWDFSAMARDFRNGFVFYGSFIFAVPTMIWFFRKNKIPALPMLDSMAFLALILHGFGRLGCFMAGCCYGKETDGPIFITFTNEAAVAPTDVHLHPTQLYSVFLLLSIFVALRMFKRHQRFEGQLFFLYIIFYAIGRGIIEIFRGDIRRGFIIEDWLSHSQFISIIMIAIVGFFYVQQQKKSKT